MNDKGLNALFMSHVLPAMQSIPELYGVNLARNYQQTQQGATTGPYVYFVKLFDRRFGHPKRRDIWDAARGLFWHEEEQTYATTYQLSAWIPQTPSDVTGLTESDILNLVSGIMQSDGVLSAFRAAGVGILRVTDVRNPYIVDDRDRFEAIPTFDVVLTHNRINVASLPAVVTYDANLGRV